MGWNGARWLLVELPIAIEWSRRSTGRLCSSGPLASGLVLQLEVRLQPVLLRLFCARRASWTGGGGCGRAVEASGADCARVCENQCARQPCKCAGAAALNCGKFARTRPRAQWALREGRRRNNNSSGGSGSGSGSSSSE